MTVSTMGSSWGGMGYRTLLVEMNEGGTAGLQAGQLVKLRSGGPRMVVEEVREDGTAVCCWNTGMVFQREPFRKEMLKSAGGVWGS